MSTHPRDRGQTLVLFALSLLGFMLISGLALDGSFAWVKQRSAQNAADFAAMAGTRIILQNLEGTARLDGDVATAIVNVATANGASVPGLGTAAGPLYTDGDGIALSPTAFVGTTSSTAAIPANARGVKVGATTAWQPFMLGIIGVTNWTAGAGATARFQPNGGGAPCAICILQGGTTGTSAVQMTAHNGSLLVNGNVGGTSAATIVADGSIEVNGNLGGSSAVQVTSNNGSILVSGNLTGNSAANFTANSGSIAVGGNLSLNSASHATAQSISVGGTVSINSASSATPTPTAGGPVSVSVSDPLAFLSNPTNPNPSATPQSYSCVSACTGSFSPTSSQIGSVTVSSASNVTLSPGLYNQISVTSASSVTLQPGTYYIAGSPVSGGNINVDSASSIKGSGAVTLVFLGQTNMTVASAAGLQITAPASSVTASTTYPYPGIAIYAARGNTATFSLTSAASAPLTGTIYAPNATLTAASASGFGVDSLVVVGTYNQYSASSLSATYNANQNVPFPGTLQLVQ